MENNKDNKEKFKWIFSKNACTDFSCKYNNQGICINNLTYKSMIIEKCKKYEREEE